MKIKIFLALIAITSSVSYNTAFAKTGHSLSLDVADVKVDQDPDNDFRFLSSNDGMLVTLGYGYQIEFNKFFVRPALNYTFGEVTMIDRDLTNDESIFSPDFAIESDFGYNINNKIGVFATLGVANSTLKRNEDSSSSDKESDMGTTFGVGVRYSLDEVISLTLKYQMSEFSYETEADSQDPEVETESFRFGLSYNF